MKRKGNRESSNVEDRRDGSAGDVGGQRSGRSIGIGTIVGALLGGWIFGIGRITILNVPSGGGGLTAQVAQPGSVQRPPVDDRLGKYVLTVLADTEDLWKNLFTKGGATYKEPRLVLFRGEISTGA